MKPSCCGTCSTKRHSCNTDYACCVECHFAWEERHALKYLPARIAREIRDQHKELKDAGYPRDKVIRHSKWEDRWFRAYCPDPVVTQIENDHTAYISGMLHSRNA